MLKTVAATNLNSTGSLTRMVRLSRSRAEQETFRSSLAPP